MMSHWTIRHLKVLIRSRNSLGASEAGEYIIVGVVLGGFYIIQPGVASICNFNHFSETIRMPASFE